MKLAFLVGSTICTTSIFRHHASFRDAKRQLQVILCIQKLIIEIIIFFSQWYIKSSLTYLSNLT